MERLKHTIVLALPAIAAVFFWMGQAGCFEPDLPDVAFRCGTEGQCPDGYECMDDGCCHKEGTPYSPADWCSPPDGGDRDASLDAGQDARVTDGQVDAQTDGAMDDAEVVDAMVDVQTDAAEDGSVDVDLSTLEPTSVVVTVQNDISLTVTLTGPAPSGGLTLTVSSDAPSIVAVPNSVTVPQSQTQVQFTATATGIGDATISVTDGTTTRQAQITVAADGGAAGDLVITEFQAIPSGQMLEFVEIYNASTHAVDIAGWFISIDGEDNSIESADLTQAPIHLLPGDYVYGVPNPANPGDIPGDAAFVYGQAGSASVLPDTGGTLALSDETTIIDEMDFTQVNTDQDATAASDEFPVLTGLATQLDAATCLNATANDDAACWCVPKQATPGGPNGTCGPYVINEVLVDPTGTDDGFEFIELYGPAGGSLASWRLRWSGTDGTVLAVASLTGRIPNNGYFVLADDTGGSTNVSNADATFALGLQNAGGGIQLITPDGTLADALGYGALTSTTDSDDGLALVEADLNDLVSVSEGQSMARSSDSADTGHNNVDFHLNATPSPGEAN